MSNDLNSLSHIIKLESFRINLKNLLLTLFGTIIGASLLILILSFIAYSQEQNLEDMSMFSMLISITNIGMLICCFTVNLLVFKKLIIDSAKDNSIQMLLGVGINRNKLFIARYIILACSIGATILSLWLSSFIIYICTLNLYPDLSFELDIATEMLGYKFILIDVFYFLIATLIMPAIAIIRASKPNKFIPAMFDGIIFASLITPQTSMILLFVLGIVPFIICFLFSFIISISIYSPVFLYIILSVLAFILFNLFAPTFVFLMPITVLLYQEELATDPIGIPIFLTIGVFTIAYTLIRSYLLYHKNIESRDY